MNGIAAMMGINLPTISATLITVSVHVPSCSVPVDRSTWVVVRRGLREDVNTYL